MSQSPHQSRWEVGIDFVLGVILNLAIQVVFLRTFTWPRGLGFTGALFLLAVVRRYGMRRGFNRLVRLGQAQSWRMSLLEAVTDTVCAIVIAFGLLVSWYPTEALSRVSGFVGTAYFLTPLWRFILRRGFEGLRGAQLGWKASGQPSSS
jgi:hypothetical protein